MAVVADDLALFRHHVVAALRTGIEEFLGLGVLLGQTFPDLEEGREAGDLLGRSLGGFHVFRLSRFAVKPQ